MLSHAQFARVPLMVDILTVCDLMSQLRDGSIYQAVSIQRTLGTGDCKKTLSKLGDRSHEQTL